MQHNKLYVIEWDDSKMATFVPAENEEEALAIFKARIHNKHRDDPDFITEIREV